MSPLQTLGSRHRRLPLLAGALALLLLAVAPSPEVADPSSSSVAAKPRQAADVPGLVSTVAGVGTYGGDGGPSQEARIYDPRGLSFAEDGALLFADTGNARVRRVSPDGIITTIAGNGSPGDSGDGGAAGDAEVVPQDIAIAPDGGYYIADAHHNKVRRVAPDGTISTVAGTGIGGFSGDGGSAARAILSSPTAVAVAPDGSLYIADAGNLRLRRVSPGGVITTVAGTGTDGDENDGGPAARASLGSLHDLAISSSGDVFIGDCQRGRVRRIAPDETITTAAGMSQRIRVPGDTPFRAGGDGGPATDASLVCPHALAISPSGELLIADVTDSRIRRISLDGTIDTIAIAHAPAGLAVDPSGRVLVASSGGVTIEDCTDRASCVTVVGRARSVSAKLYGTGDFFGDGGPAVEAGLNGPADVAVADDGTLYIADTVNYRVRRVDPEGTISTIARSSSTNWHLALAPDGRLIVADINTIQLVQSDGSVVTIAGSPSAEGFSGDGGPATAARFSWIASVAVSADGSIYAADRCNHRVRRIDPDGIVTTVAGSGPTGSMAPGAPCDEIGGYDGDSGPATESRLRSPSGLAFGPDGSLFIADSGNHRVRVVRPDGVIETFAGADQGPRPDHELASRTTLGHHPWEAGPGALAVAADGTVYVGAGTRLLRVDPNGIISILAGGTHGGSAGDGQPLINARFRSLSALALPPDDNLYVADDLDHRIRKVERISAATGLRSASPFSQGDVIPRTARPATVMVQAATDGWTRANITAVAGDTVRITASGRWCWGPEPSQCSTGGGGGMSHTMPRFREGAPGQLVAKVGETGILLGDAVQFTAPDNGEILLRMNDIPSEPTGRTGNLRAQLAVWRQP